MSNQIETLNASAIYVKHNPTLVDIYVRTNDGMITITEKKDNIVVFLKMLKSIYSQMFELYVGDHACKKYKIRLPLEKFELVFKELQPLINALDLSQSLRAS